MSALTRQRNFNLNRTGSIPTHSSGRQFPAFDLWDDEKCFYAALDIPGVELKDLSLAIDGEDLHVVGHRRAAQSAEAKIVHQEFYSGDFHRIVKLPAEVDASTAEAFLRNGVLTILLPKKWSSKKLRVSIQNHNELSGNIR